MFNLSRRKNKLNRIKMTESKKWTQRNPGEKGTHPLQELHEILTRTSRDVGEDRMIACMYGIIVGWDNASYKELKKSFRWSDANIQFQKEMHKKYIKAWNLFYDEIEKERTKPNK